jgi:acid phosphatase
MLKPFTISKALPLLVSTALAAVDYPPIPEDLTTPYQQRLAIYGPNGEQQIIRSKS